MSRIEAEQLRRDANLAIAEHHEAVQRRRQAVLDDIVEQKAAL
jgi:hypothetical protein